jgi:hypothetical protein
MKVGDLVRRVPMGTDPQEAADYAELGIGVVVGIDNRDYHNVTNVDYIVMWPHLGIGWEFPDSLEVVNESR